MTDYLGSVYFIYLSLIDIGGVNILENSVICKHFSVFIVYVPAFSLDVDSSFLPLTVVSVLYWLLILGYSISHVEMLIVRIGILTEKLKHCFYLRLCLILRIGSEVVRDRDSSWLKVQVLVLKVCSTYNHLLEVFKELMNLHYFSVPSTFSGSNSFSSSIAIEVRKI